jgi:membrane-associated phospholipid phosphatase
MKLIFDIFKQLGENGPFILYIISLYLLWNKSTLYTYYNIGFFINTLLNLIVKGIIQQPRPDDDPKAFQVALKNGKRFIFKDGLYYDIFGMPSGHAQSVLYSTAFIAISLKNKNILLFFIAISILTICQRVIYRHHDINQVCIGGLIGILIGYVFFCFSQTKIKGNIREKPDDNAK